MSISVKNVKTYILTSYRSIKMRWLIIETDIPPKSNEVVVLSGSKQKIISQCKYLSLMRILPYYGNVFDFILMPIDSL